MQQMAKQTGPIMPVTKCSAKRLRSAFCYRKLIVWIKECLSNNKKSPL
jgi:hypothetical protein